MVSSCILPLTGHLLTQAAGVVLFDLLDGWLNTSSDALTTDVCASRHDHVGILLVHKLSVSAVLGGIRLILADTEANHGPVRVRVDEVSLTGSRDPVIAGEDQNVSARLFQNLLKALLL